MWTILNILVITSTERESLPNSITSRDTSSSESSFRFFAFNNIDIAKSDFQSCQHIQNVEVVSGWFFKYMS